MAYTSELCFEDRQRVNAIIDELTYGTPGVSPTEITRQLVARMMEFSDDGELWARRALADLAVDGGRSHVNRRLKEDLTTVMVSHSGTPISVPSRIGVNAVADSGERERWSQQWLWWELSWDRFEEHVRMRRQQIAKLDSHLEAFEDILFLRTQFPSTRTPLEACEAAGIDPRSFNLNEEVA